MSSPRTLAVLVTLALASACGSKAPEPPSTAPGKTVDAATAGAVTGKVTFDGTPPANDTLRMSIDAACVQESGPNPLNDAILVAGGAVQNVYVWVKDGLDPSYTFPVPTTPVKLDQKGCRYSPRVVGLRAGQTLDVFNSDDTTHNVHAIPKQNNEFNQSTPLKNTHMTHVFTVPEVMVRFTCNVHAWMQAWVGVTTHPFFAVTGADGAFEIKGLPPGTYTLEAWHEKFGRLEQKVTIAEKQTAAAAFAFKASAQ